ncbi:MAG: AAA family ATPase [Nitrosopumilaceae archaeon]
MTKEFTTNAIEDEIYKFLTRFNHGKYTEKIDELRGSNLLINFLDVIDYDQENNNELQLVKFLTDKPKEFIEVCSNAILKIFSEKHGKEKADQLDLTVQIDDAAKELTFDDAIRNKYLNKLVKLRALVIGESQLKFNVLENIWICPNNHHTNSLTKPRKCLQKGCENPFSLESDDSQLKTENYRDYYLNNSDLNEHRQDILICEAGGDLTNSMNPGHEVELVGYITTKQRDKGQFFNVLHLLHVKAINEIKYEITEEEKTIFSQWPNEEGFYKKLIDSFAPEIYDCSLLKESWLVMYIGAPKWEEGQKNWINVLCVGDPGTAKSKMAQYAKRVLPNVSIVAAKAGSAKGLFAGQKEQVDGQKILEYGPMIALSDRGVLCIDEFVRMEEVYDIFYGPMELGTYTSATVGGHADLPARTAVYATGNPKLTNQWNELQSVAENLQVIDIALLSRFDLIIIMKDNYSLEEKDKIVRTVLRTKNDGDVFSSENEKQRINEHDFVKYLTYCKTFQPKLTDECKEVIRETVLDIFKKKMLELNDTKYGDVNMRVIGTLSRITLAIARIHLHHETQIEDVGKAHDLFQRYLNQRGLAISNANTYVERIGQKVIGLIKLSKIETGMSDSEIYEDLLEMYRGNLDQLFNDISQLGPHRDINRKWRYVMEWVEKSIFVEKVSRKPIKLRWKQDQKTLDESS